LVGIAGLLALIVRPLTTLVDAVARLIARALPGSTGEAVPAGTRTTCAAWRSTGRAAA
jgi:hypothetical protein